MLVLSLNLVLVLFVKPLIALGVFDTKEAMLNHDEEDVLNDTINKMMIRVTYTMPQKVKIIK